MCSVFEPWGLSSSSQQLVPVQALYVYNAPACRLCLTAGSYQAQRSPSCAACLRCCERAAVVLALLAGLHCYPLCLSCLGTCALTAQKLSSSSNSSNSNSSNSNSSNSNSSNSSSSSRKSSSNNRSTVRQHQQQMLWMQKVQTVPAEQGAARKVPKARGLRQGTALAGKASGARSITSFHANLRQLAALVSPVCYWFPLYLRGTGSNGSKMFIQVLYNLTII